MTFTRISCHVLREGEPLHRSSIPSSTGNPREGAAGRVLPSFTRRRLQHRLSHKTDRRSLAVVTLTSSSDPRQPAARCARLWRSYHVNVGFGRWQTSQGDRAACLETRQRNLCGYIQFYVRLIYYYEYYFYFSFNILVDLCVNYSPLWDQGICCLVWSLHDEAPATEAPESIFLALSGCHTFIAFWRHATNLEKICRCRRLSHWEAPSWKHVSV